MLEKGKTSSNKRKVATHQSNQDLFSYTNAETSNISEKKEPAYPVISNDSFLPDRKETTSIDTTEKLLSLLSTTPVHIDELARLSNLSIRTLCRHFLWILNLITRSSVIVAIWFHANKNKGTSEREVPENIRNEIDFYLTMTFALRLARL